MKKIVLLVLTLVVALSLTPLISGGVDDVIYDRGVATVEFEITRVDPELGAYTATVGTYDEISSYVVLGESAFGYNRVVNVIEFKIDNVVQSPTDYLKAVDIFAWGSFGSNTLNDDDTGDSSYDTYPTGTNVSFTFDTTSINEGITPESIAILELLPLFYVVVVILGGVLFAYFSFKKE